MTQPDESVCRELTTAELSSAAITLDHGEGSIWRVTAYINGREAAEVSNESLEAAFCELVTGTVRIRPTRRK